MDAFQSAVPPPLHHHSRKCLCLAEVLMGSTWPWSQKPMANSWKLSLEEILNANGKTLRIEYQGDGCEVSTRPFPQKCLPNPNVPFLVPLPVCMADYGCMVFLPPPFFCTLLSYGLRLQGHLLTTSASAELVEMAMKSQSLGYTSPKFNSKSFWKVTRPQ